MSANPPQQEQTDLAGLRVGTAPVNWNNNDLAGWRPWVPFPAILDVMRAGGYTESEWDESFGNDVGLLNSARSARGVTFTGAYRWLDFVDTDRFEQDIKSVMPFLHTLQGIGARHLIVADSLRPHRVAIAGSVPVDGSASLDDAAYGRMAENLDRLAEVAAPFGLAVHYHNHAGTYIESPAEVAALMDRLAGSGVDLCFDTGHYAFGGGQAFDFLASNHDRVGYLHLKDVDERVLADTKRHSWSFLDALRHYIFCPIGSGNARIADIVDLLVAVRFSHWVIIEQDTCREESTANARQNLELVRTFEQAANRTRRTTL